MENYLWYWGGIVVGILSARYLFEWYPKKEK